MFTLQASDIADKLFYGSLVGGATVSATFTGSVPTSGYVVGYANGLALQDDLVDSIGTMTKFIEQNLATVVYFPRHYFGIWDGSDGMTYVDVVKVFSEYAQAMDFARDNNQRAVYNLATEKDIKVKAIVPVRLAKAPFTAYHGKHRAEDYTIDYKHPARRVDYVHTGR